MMSSSCPFPTTSCRYCLGILRNSGDLYSQCPVTYVFAALTDKIATRFTGELALDEVRCFTVDYILQHLLAETRRNRCVGSICAFWKFWSICGFCCCCCLGCCLGSICASSTSLHLFLDGRVKILASKKI